MTIAYNARRYNVNRTLEIAETQTGSEMRILWDAPIEMDDSTALRADVFLPDKQGKYPVIVTLGPYGKGLSFQKGYKDSWDRKVAAFPQIGQY
jgi:uncharacterized protein